MVREIFIAVFGCFGILFSLLGIILTFLIERYYKITSQMEHHKYDNVVKEKEDK